MRLGKQPAVRDPRTLRLAHYLDALPPAKRSVTNSRAVKTWPMLRNDELGDCVPAGILHGVQLLRAIAGRDWTPTDDDAVAVYEQVAGYDPNDPSTDQGTDELAALKAWRKGLHLADGGTSRIDGFAAVDLQNAAHIKVAIDVFGFVLNGLELPATAKAQRRKWTVTQTTGGGAPGTWGGHCTISPDFTASTVQNVTWGEKLPMTWGFLGTYESEGYVVVTRDALDRAGRFKGLDEKALLADLAAL